MAPPSDLDVFQTCPALVRLTAPTAPSRCHIATRGRRAHGLALNVLLAPGLLARLAAAVRALQGALSDVVGGQNLTGGIAPVASHLCEAALDIIPDGRKRGIAGAQAVESRAIRTVRELLLDATKSPLKFLPVLLPEIVKPLFRRHERHALLLQPLLMLCLLPGVALRQTLNLAAQISKLCVAFLALGLQAPNDIRGRLPASRCSYLSLFTGLPFICSCIVIIARSLCSFSGFFTEAIWVAFI